jgi:hypothetical protein
LSWRRAGLGDTQRAVVVVKHHKTGPKESALLVADATTVPMLGLWPGEVIQTNLPESSLVFPEYDGTTLLHLEGKISKAARSLGHILPTATCFRKKKN